MDHLNVQEQQESPKIYLKKVLEGMGNHIGEEVAEELGLKQTETKSFVVEVGNGQQVKRSADVVLGLEWLETLGDIQANFKTLTLKFEIGGQTQVVRGDPSLSKLVASLKTLLKALQIDGEGFYVDFNELSTREEQENLDLQQLLEEFGTLFEELKGLSPSRSHDHAIRINEGSNPPNIHLYCYPHYQKNEIERIVQEMLVVGIIQPTIGVSADPAKITSMINWPSPKDVKGFGGFLGLTGYYRNFVRDYGKTARPLTQFLKKDVFRWNKEAQLAFDSLKEAMVTLTTLDDLFTEIQQDDQLRQLTQDLLQDPASRPNYVLKNGCLFFKSHLVIPRSSIHIHMLLRGFHSSLTGGHSGFFRTYKRISQVLYWSGIKRDVQNFVASCEVWAHPTQWPRWIPWAEFWFNTTYHGSTKMTPFRALYGRYPPSLLRFTDEISVVEKVNQQLIDHNTILDELKANLTHAQAQMKVYANAKHREVVFQPCDLVYLRMQHFKLRSLAKKVNQKLSPRYYGPYTILNKIGEVAYRLDLPPHSRVHPIFHVSWLKRSVKDSTPIQQLPPFLSEELEMKVQPESVVDCHTLLNGCQEVLIKWEDLLDFENTWESYEVIDAQFPQFHLEDKVKLVRAGIVRPAINRVYSHRKKGENKA
ncbi:hypothetical protein KY289_020236 [Solanum tuberosum]|nr:hypothetical protein KY289_020236 [Solanum tuberosum]